VQASLRTRRSSTRHTAERLETLLQRVFRAAGTDYLQAIEGTGLSLTQVKALSVLNTCGASGEGPIPVNDMAARLGLSLPTASRALDGLARKGLVKRSEDDHDRRVRRLAVTPKGARLINELIALRTAGLARYLGQLPAEDREAVDAAIDTILEAIQ
jgi:DNA-binding MarR family transcriptional regulator